MTKKLFYSILPAIIILLFGCSSPDVEVIDAEFAKSIYVSTGQPIVLEGITSSIGIGEKGIWCSFQNHDIIKITLDFNFKALDTKEEIGTDKHQSEVYRILNENAHMYNGENEIKLVWGYWPEETTGTSASDMKLFYVIPDSTDLKNLKFEYDTSLLNGVKGKYSYAKFDKMKPLEEEKETTKEEGS
ncbi:MAG: hypothetical protein RDU14_00825 [Melioribacteraceae bacterium]|nr:hypothetical protein [Melioribacteraceae bacterium]